MTGVVDVTPPAALFLLERGIAFGHDRLAVVRLSIAVEAGAQVPAQYWAFCERAVQRSQDVDLHALMSAARRRLSTQPNA